MMTLSEFITYAIGAAIATWLRPSWRTLIGGFAVAAGLQLVLHALVAHVSVAVH
jgi:hypothetical protein